MTLIPRSPQLNPNDAAARDPILSPMGQIENGRNDPGVCRMRACRSALASASSNLRQILAPPGQVANLCNDPIRGFAASAPATGIDPAICRLSRSSLPPRGSNRESEQRPYTGLSRAGARDRDRPRDVSSQPTGLAAAGVKSRVRATTLYGALPRLRPPPGLPPRCVVAADRACRRGVKSRDRATTLYGALPRLRPPPGSTPRCVVAAHRSCRREGQIKSPSNEPIRGFAAPVPATGIDPAMCRRSPPGLPPLGSNRESAQRPYTGLCSAGAGGAWTAARAGPGL